MNIGSICSTDVITIDHQASVQDAARRMREQHVGALVVTARTSQGTSVVGVVTDRDLAVEVLARGHDSQELTVDEVASTRTVAVPATASVADAVALMRTEGVRRLLVTNADRDLAGIVSLDDLVATMADTMADLAHAMQSGIERETLERRPVEAAPSSAVQVPIEALATPWRQVASA